MQHWMSFGYHDDKDEQVLLPRKTGLKIGHRASIANLYSNSEI